MTSKKVISTCILYISNDDLSRLYFNEQYNSRSELAMTKHTKIKVGIVGGSVNPESWAIKSHIPALFNNDDFELVAVSTSNQTSAMNAKRTLKIKYSYDNYHELIQNKEIDLVVISIKAPLHYEIIKESIIKQKHVYSEWPLTNNINQATELTTMAIHANIHNVIGLQSRQSSVLNQAKNIIKDGKLGEIFSVNMQVATQGKGKFTTKRTAYQFDPNNGATLLDINGGHALDCLTFLLGDFTALSVSSSHSFKTIHNVETNKNCMQSTPNIWEIIGKINNNISANVSIFGGVLPQFTLLIRGEYGSLRITQKNSVGHPQFGNLVLEECLHRNVHLIKSSQDHTFRKVVIEQEDESLQSYFKSIYSKLSQDIKKRNYTLPDFSEGLKLQLLLNKIKSIQNK